MWRSHIGLELFLLNPFALFGMKTYAQFFQKGVMTGNLIEACGDRSIIRLDGRMNQLSMETIAEEECKNRGYIAWQLIRGCSLLQAKPITKVSSIYY
jgi:hypothetical protein